MPWRLIIGNYCWIGEDTWIDNISFVTLKDNICILKRYEVYKSILKLKTKHDLFIEKYLVNAKKPIIHIH